MFSALFLLAIAEPSAAQESARPPMSAHIRYRQLSVPDGILDTWYYNLGDDGATETRPSIRANVVGVEFAVEPRPTSFIFYFEYIKSGMEAGYWDDIESPPNHFDGDWIEPVNLGLFALGANFAHEVPLWSEEAPVWMGLMFGGGLGMGFSKGHLNHWRPGMADGHVIDCMPGSTAIVRKDQCEPDETPGIWPVAPILDVTMSARFHIMEYGSLRFDFGIHNALYWGLAAGGSF